LNESEQGKSRLSDSTPPRVLPACSVVVCTYKRPLQLQACLTSLRRVNYPQFEVVVVQNHAEDAGARDIAEGEGAHYFAEPARGLSRARNRGARASSGEIVAYLDDDAVADPGWLAAIVREFSDERVMAVTGRIVPANVETEAERIFAAAGGFSLGDESLLVLDRSNNRWFELACFGGIGNGGNMAFRKAAFDRWPGFDERLGAGTPIAGGEEHYAFFSLIERGFRVVHAPDAVVRHPFPASIEELRSRAARQLASMAAYTLFLFAEQPRYRRRLARLALGSVFKRRGAGSSRSPRSGLGAGSRFRAYITGVGRYFESRRAPREGVQISS
jgi:glycosyltransferase involved in cell wall biosynthesis